MTHNVAILGASGYTGAELVRLIATHPNLQIAGLSGNSKAGMSMTEVFPHLRHLDLPKLTTIEDMDLRDVDLVFCGLPHATSQKIISGLPDTVKIVDMSADFRLRDPQDYEKWYGKPHAAPDLQKSAVYGLTEFYRDEIAEAHLVAGTGCNAAAGMYAVLPLIKAGVIDVDHIIFDLKATVSGAGRSLKENLMHAELSEGAYAYAAGGTHRHLGEFDQEFSLAAGKAVQVQLTPHLLPANRGVLMTAYLHGDAQEIYDALDKTYAREPFIEVLPMGHHPSLKHVRASNFCHLGVVPDRIAGRAIVVSVLDNLTKGSAGQALQNANLMLGLPETEGLMLAPVFP